jgi:protein-S-isoprenylcysteine O-methyltransferase Ste14
MSIPKIRDAKAPGGVHLPRRAALLLGLFAALIVYPVMTVAVPWAFSLLGPRYGWSEGGPAAGNRLGLIAVVAGIAGLVWVFGVMLAQVRHIPGGFELEEGERLMLATGRVLLTRGPFAWSRNPMFLSGQIVWLGWAIFYGSPVVLIVALVLWASSHYLTVPREERALEARYGDAYREYRRRVPRWLGPGGR